jgi:hypothetical protein
MEINGSLQCSQEPVTDHHSEPDESNHQYAGLYLKVYFNINPLRPYIYLLRDLLSGVLTKLCTSYFPMCATFPTIPSSSIQS